MTRSRDRQRVVRDGMDICDIFGEAQDRAQDSLPLHPNDRQIECISPDFGAACWAMYQRAHEPRAERATCPVCHKPIEREDGQMGRPRIYDRDACRKKAFRIRHAPGT